MKCPWEIPLLLTCAFCFSSPLFAAPAPHSRDTAILATKATLAEIREELTSLQTESTALSAQLRQWEKGAKSKKSLGLSLLSKASKKRSLAAKTFYLNVLRRDSELARASLANVLRFETLTPLQNIAAAFGAPASQTAVGAMAQVGDISNDLGNLCQDSVAEAEALLTSAAKKGTSISAVDRRLVLALSALQMSAKFRGEFEEVEALLEESTVPTLYAAAQSASQSMALEHLQSALNIYSNAASQALTSAEFAQDQSLFLTELLKGSDILGDTPQTALLEEQLASAIAARIQFSARALAHKQAQDFIQRVQSLALQSGVPLSVVAQTAEALLAMLAEQNSLFISAQSSSEAFQAEIPRLRSLVNRTGFATEIKAARALLKIHRAEGCGTAKKNVAYFSKLFSSLAKHFASSPQAGMVSLEILLPSLASITDTSLAKVTERNTQSPGLQAALTEADATYATLLQSVENGGSELASLATINAAKEAVALYVALSDKKNWEAYLTYSLEELISSTGLAAANRAAIRKAGEEVASGKNGVSLTTIKSKLSASLRVCRSVRSCEERRRKHFANFFRIRRSLFTSPKAALNRATLSVSGLALSEIQEKARAALQGII